MEEVEKLPPEPEDGEVYSITSKHSRKLTHNFFQYPCTFIPRIPEWAIEEYASPGDAVLDPFAGSGTTLVESNFRGHPSFGIDFDPLSRLLVRAKTTPLEEKELEELEELRETMLEQLPSDRMYEDYTPDLHNLDHWFPEESIRDLSRVKKIIEEEDLDDSQERILQAAIADITKEVSNADPSSPKPYVSTNIEKQPKEVGKAIDNSLENKIDKLRNYSRDAEGEGAELVSEDARDIPELDQEVTLAVTSPPYINAFDYVRCLKLENIWLDFIEPDKTNEKKKEQIGHEKIYADQYRQEPEKLGIDTIDPVISDIYREDRKRGHVVREFFEDMEKNLQEVHKVLEDDGRYVIVVGKNRIRDYVVDTPETLVKIAERNGFELEKKFRYVIKNKYLNIPRQGRGGDIEEDYVIVLKKT